MELLLAIGIGVVAIWLLAHVIMTVVLIARASRSKLQELQHLQGPVTNVLSGRLKHAPKNCDYRVVQGLEWDEKAKKFVPQSRLSTEALKSAFF